MSEPTVKHDDPLAPLVQDDYRDIRRILERGHTRTATDYVADALEDGLQGIRERNALCAWIRDTMAPSVHNEARALLRAIRESAT